jgi:hypothetical protein
MVETSDAYMAARIYLRIILMGREVAMRWLLAVAMMILSTSTAYADSFYKLVGYECDEKADAVILTYKGALNEAGKEMMKNKSPRQWDPWKLIIRDTKKRELILQRNVSLHLFDKVQSFNSFFSMRHIGNQIATQMVPNDLYCSLFRE